jgi:hypothetical protein
MARANGTVMTGGSVGNTTIDFTAAPNHIVLINSSVKVNGNLTIIGSGTLMVEGSMEFHGSLGSASNPVNILIVVDFPAPLWPRKP